MGNWFKRIAGLHGDSRGETLVEVLVSVLIAGLAILMLATVIATVVNITGNGAQGMTGYYDDNKNLATMTGTASASVTLVDSAGRSVSWWKDDPGNGRVDVQYTTGVKGATPAIAYRS